MNAYLIKLKKKTLSNENKISEKILFFLLKKYFKIISPTLIRSRKGKPFLRSKGIHFSVSHKRNLFLYVFSKKEKLGIDLEEISQKKSRYSLELLAKRFFSIEEYKLLKKNSFPLREFYRLWTIKEALFKLKGGNFFKILKKDLEKIKNNFFIKEIKVQKKIIAHLVVPKNRISKIKEIKLVKVNFPP